MACKKSKEDKYYGSCFECPFSQEYCDRANGGEKEYKEKLKAIHLRNQEIQMLQQNGYSMRKLRKITGLSRSHLRSIEKGLYA